MVFLDLSMALDTLDHYTMLEKLCFLGFLDAAVFWFKAYLTNRTKSVNVHGVFSDPQSIQFGVPQSSILGPLLFIVYINNLQSVVQNCDVQLYADETLLFLSSNSTKQIKTYYLNTLTTLFPGLRRIFPFLTILKLR